MLDHLASYMRARIGTKTLLPVVHKTDLQQELLLVQLYDSTASSFYPRQHITLFDIIPLLYLIPYDTIGGALDRYHHLHHSECYYGGTGGDSISALVMELVYNSFKVRGD